MFETLNNLLSRLRSDAYDPVSVVVELLLIGLCVNWCASVLQGTRGTRPLRGVLVVLVVATLVVRVLAVQMGWVRLDLLYRYILIGLAFIALVVFQPELRRAVIRAGDVRLPKRGAPQSSLIAALVKAAGQLSKNRFGALIAIQRSVDLRAWAENGTLINAEASANLLNSIFYPNSALHDLGVIIRGNQIVAANCQFPLADSDEVDLSLGSRHLAALGMSYETDALVLVVSEETGVISIADNGELKRFLSLDDLDTELTTRLAGFTVDGDPEMRMRSRRSRLWRAVRRTAVVAPIAMAIWYLADQATLGEIKIPRVELRAKSEEPTRLVDVIKPEPPVFSVSFRGTTAAIDRLRNQSGERLAFDWVLPPSDRTGTSSYSVREVIENLKEIRGRGLSVVEALPGEIEVNVDELVTVPMRIEASAGATRIVDVRVEPTEARVTLRKPDLERLPETARVVLAPLEGRLADVVVDQVATLTDVPLAEKVGNSPVVFLEPRVARITLRIVGQQIAKRLPGVVVWTHASPETIQNFNVERQEPLEWLIDVEVEGERGLVEALQSKDILAFVPVTSDMADASPDPQFRQAEVTIQSPPGISVTSPKRFVQLRLTPRTTSTP